MYRKLLGLMIALFLCGCRNTAQASNQETIGIIGAMSEEVEILKEAAKSQRTTQISGMEFAEGTLGGNHVIIVQSGMGKVNAGICAETLITKFGVSAVINTGVAGSLDSQLGIGDIVISTDSVQHDFDVSPIGYQRGEIPYTGQYAFAADETLQKKAAAAAAAVAPDTPCFSGRVCSGDQFINQAEQRKEITENFGGLCCEMEGGAIAQVCHLNSTPYVIIRAISDTADASNEMEYAEFKKEAAAHCTSITQHMLEHWADTAE